MPDPRIEEWLHRLPEPQPLDPDAPFVGNETRDDNLAESIRVALWNATGGHCRAIGTEVFGGRVVLSGHVDSERIARRCEDEVATIAGVTSIHNLLSWND